MADKLCVQCGKPFYDSSPAQARRFCSLKCRMKTHRHKGDRQPGTPCDGQLLRSGSANLSASGLKRQDNDLITIRSPEAAKAFRRNFEPIFAAGIPLDAVQNRDRPAGWLGR